MVRPDALHRRVRLTDLHDPRLAPYRNLRDAELADRHNLFIAEGRLVVPVLLSPRSRYAVHSVLGAPIALDALERVLADRRVVDATDAREAPPVYEVDQRTMDAVVGFHIHRGLLAAGVRAEAPTVRQLLAQGSDSASDRRRTPPAGFGFVVAVEDLTNHDNLGGVFRNAAAFAADAVLFTPACCDHLYRKCIRVSMGHVLTTPVATWPGRQDGAQLLGALGYTTVALTPDRDAEPIEHLADRLRSGDAGAPVRVAVVVGAEGPGLHHGTVAEADAVVRIPMAPSVDSLNTATATGVALHHVARLLGRLDAARRPEPPITRRGSLR